MTEARKYANLHRQDESPHHARSCRPYRHPSADFASLAGSRCYSRTKAKQDSRIDISPMDRPRRGAGEKVQSRSLSKGPGAEEESSFAGEVMTRQGVALRGEARLPNRSGENSSMTIRRHTNPLRVCLTACLDTSLCNRRCIHNNLSGGFPCATTRRL